MKISFPVEKEYEGRTLKSYLKYTKEISTRSLRALKYRGGEIKINGENAKLIDVLKHNDLVEIIFPVASSAIEPENIDIEIIYEDDYMVAINKPPFMVVHPTKSHQTNTLAHALKNHALKKGETYLERFVNRLDMDTSGVVLACKVPIVQDLWTKASMKGQIKKTYITVAFGKLENKAGIIEGAIYREGNISIKRIVDERGKEARTKYEVLGEAKDEYGQNVTLLKINILTGRTHQIRVHLEHMGLKIIGDGLYGKTVDYIQRQALHALSLEFVHPITKNEVTINAELTDDMKKLLLKFNWNLNALLDQETY